MSPRVHNSGISTCGGALLRGPFGAAYTARPVALPGLLTLLLTSP